MAVFHQVPADDGTYNDKNSDDREHRV
jgi:hypothetical protein